MGGVVEVLGARSVRRLLDPRLNAIAGLVLVVGATVWTVLTIVLTSEPPNVIAMSGLALVLAGVQLVQGSLTMRKLEVETSSSGDGEHADEVRER